MFSSKYDLQTLKEIQKQIEDNMNKELTEQELIILSWYESKYKDIQDKIEGIILKNIYDKKRYEYINNRRELELMKYFIYETYYKDRLNYDAMFKINITGEYWIPNYNKLPNRRNWRNFKEVYSEELNEIENKYQEFLKYLKQKEQEDRDNDVISYILWSKNKND